MKRSEVEAFFTLAGFDIKGLKQLENRYWPKHQNYDEMRQKYPWWEVTTEEGVIVIGWRKSVINIDWSGTSRRGLVTEDDVTKDITMVHAWTKAKAVEYLSNVRSLPICSVTADGLKEYRSEKMSEIKSVVGMLVSSKPAPEVQAVLSVLDGLSDDHPASMTCVKIGDDTIYSFSIRLGLVNISIHPEVSKED